MSFVLSRDPFVIRESQTGTLMTRWSATAEMIRGEPQDQPSQVLGSAAQEPPPAALQCRRDRVLQALGYDGTGDRPLICRAALLHVTTDEDFSARE